MGNCDTGVFSSPLCRAYGCAVCMRVGPLEPIKMSIVVRLSTDHSDGREEAVDASSRQLSSARGLTKWVAGSVGWIYERGGPQFADQRPDPV